MAHHSRKYYVNDEQVKMEENFTTEFKCHTNIAVEEIPSFCTMPNSDRMSRSTISRAICGFLNTGQGGTIYLGITDEGTVIGRFMTPYTMDHLKLSLEDTMSRYTPPVEDHRYKVSFVPALDSSVPEENADEVIAEYKRAEFDFDVKTRKTDHILRSGRDCWCHRDQKIRFQRGLQRVQYIVEIKVKPWNPSDPRNKYTTGKMRTHPIHQDELGRALFRKHASVETFTLEDVTQYAVKQVNDQYTPILGRLREELAELSAEEYEKKPKSAAKNDSRTKPKS